MPTGTMGNLASVLAHCGRGEEVLLGSESHIFHYEAGGVSALVRPMPVLVYFCLFAIFLVCAEQHMRPAA